MSLTAALISVKSDVKSQGLEDFPSKPFFLTVKKKHLSAEQFTSKFYLGFPGWDKVNGDEYHINNCQLTIPDSSSHEYEVELSYMISWMEAHLKGEFHVAGVHYYKKVIIQFQFKEDMDKAKNRFNG